MMKSGCVQSPGRQWTVIGWYYPQLMEITDARDPVHSMNGSSEMIEWGRSPGCRMMNGLLIVIQLTRLKRGISELSGGVRVEHSTNTTF